MRAHHYHDVNYSEEKPTRCFSSSPEDVSMARPTDHPGSPDIKIKGRHKSELGSTVPIKVSCCCHCCCCSVSVGGREALHRWLASRSATNLDVLYN